MAQRIPHIEARLDRWGEWLLRTKDGGGRSHISSIYAGRPRVQTSDHAQSIELGDPEAALTDRLVVWLGCVDRSLYWAVHTVHYTGRHRSLRHNARYLGCSHTALAARLARADLALDQQLRARIERAEAARRLPLKMNCASIPTRG